jgi:DNA polymerase III delta prime subunit
MTPTRLFVGSDQEELQKAARRTAQEILCRKKMACGECEACRQLQRGIHPDVQEFSGTEKAGIKEIRQMLQQLQRSAWHGLRVALLYNIEQLSLPALTTLLKPLEEPRETLIFLLTSTQAQRLPETILSRCERVFIAKGWQNKLDDLIKLEMNLRTQLETRGPAPEVKWAYSRLRDYYQVRSKKGNVKLAKQVLVASLHEIDHTLAANYDFK